MFIGPGARDSPAWQSLRADPGWALILHVKILDSALLLTIDLRGQEQNNKVPRFENELQHANRFSFTEEKSIMTPDRSRVLKNRLAVTRLIQIA